MKKLWLLVIGCFLVILSGCHTNKEVVEESQFPVLTHFITIVHEVKGYDSSEREKFIQEALTLKESPPSNPLLENLTNELEMIGFTEEQPFLEDTSDNPLNSLNMKYSINSPSKSLFLVLTYRFNSTILPDNLQLALTTTNIEDSAELSSVFKLDSPIEEVFESLLPLFSNQTPIEKDDLVSNLKEVDATFEEIDGGQKQSYSISDDQSSLNISYNPETKLVELMTYTQGDFEKSSYFDNNQVCLSIVSYSLNQEVFETTIYEPLVNYLSNKLIPENQ